MNPGELAEIACIYLAMEEIVDMLTLVMWAKHGIYALRVRPQPSLRSTLYFSLGAACVYGFLKMAALGNV